MSGEGVFSRRLLIGWAAGAIAVFAVSLFFLGAGEVRGPDPTGPSTYSRSAIGHAGIAEVLQRLGLPVVRSSHNSLDKLSAGSVLVIAEPRPGRESEQSIHALLRADTILLVLPKWTGQPSQQTAGWIRNAHERVSADAQWALGLVAPRAQVARERGDVRWTTNALGLAPNLASPTQLIRAAPALRAIIGGEQGMLLAEIRERDRRIWILSDPDVIANHGLARDGNAALALALFKHLRSGDGSIVFDETVHGYSARPANPLLLMFRFPFVVATLQGLIALALLLWASLARFGSPQTAPPPLSAGRGGLLQNVAKLIERAGHQQEMVARYVQETVRDAGRQLHAPRGLGEGALVEWLGRVGNARGVSVDCGALIRRASELGQRRREGRALVRLARDAHRWKQEILDGRSRHPRHR
jgi:hypothetical protein